MQAAPAARLLWQQAALGWQHLLHLVLAVLAPAMVPAQACWVPKKRAGCLLQQLASCQLRWAVLSPVLVMMALLLAPMLLLALVLLASFA